MDTLLKEIRKCTICSESLPFGPNPIVAGSEHSKLLIIGQAPGRRVHESSIPWDDPSGDHLRQWLGIEKEVFYDVDKIALVPMGFCYPGSGKSGDLPPRPECAEAWHEKLTRALTGVKLTLLIGQYAQKYYLKKTFKSNLTETVREWKTFMPDFLPLPHPSPRNRIWMKKNEWFASDVLPILQKNVTDLLV